MIGYGQSLEKIIRGVVNLKKIKKRELKFGDLVVISTRNSVYHFCVLENDFYIVFGGYFDRKGFSPRIITINGCTWGGSIIKVDIFAACGLRIEFGNRVVTTVVEKIWIIPGCIQN
ncbi:MAG: hypothetical protein ACE5LC_05315 [Candidatus Aminicenantales bacterium]